MAPVDSSSFHRTSHTLLASALQAVAGQQGTIATRRKTLRDQLPNSPCLTLVLLHVARDTACRIQARCVKFHTGDFACVCNVVFAPQLQDTGSVCLLVRTLVLGAEHACYEQQRRTLQKRGSALVDWLLGLCPDVIDQHCAIIESHSQNCWMNGMPVLCEHAR